MGPAAGVDVVGPVAVGQGAQLVVGPETQVFTTRALRPRATVRRAGLPEVDHVAALEHSHHRVAAGIFLYRAAFEIRYGAGLGVRREVVAMRVAGIDPGDVVVL